MYRKVLLLNIAAKSLIHYSMWNLYRFLSKFCNNKGVTCLQLSTGIADLFRKPVCLFVSCSSSKHDAISDLQITKKK